MPPPHGLSPAHSSPIKAKPKRGRPKGALNKTTIAKKARIDHEAESQAIGKSPAKGDATDGGTALSATAVGVGDPVASTDTRQQTSGSTASGQINEPAVDSSD